MAVAEDDPVAECCILHTFERGTRVCHDCGHWHCDACVVTPWGPRKAALCVNCAIARGGVRRTATNAPARPPKEIRQLEKDVRRQRADEEDGRRSLHRAAGAVAAARVDVGHGPKKGLLSRFRSS